MVTMTEYTDFYKQWNEKSAQLWANKNRPEYEADLWYSHNRNEIAMDMIGDRWKDEDVLAIGASFWVDEELLKNIKSKSVIRTDLIQSEGIDVIADACHLPFDDNSFSAILCREVIEHVQEDSELLYEARRVLKDNGWLFITTPNCFNVLPDGVSHVRGFTPFSFIAALNHYKFSIVDKRGNTPNIHHGLMHLARKGFPEFLEEFKEVSRLFDRYEHSYFFGSELFILARKEAI